MIQYHSTFYIRDCDEELPGNLHISHGLVVVEVPSGSSMADIRDFIQDRVTGEISFKECTFMAAEDWAMMVASETIQIAMTTASDYNENVKATNLKKKSWLQKFWEKGYKK